ncbi:MAG: bifunctional adenosylcobinamide kinase/adenosylcobinamide-phosphate guanylyltransferase [Deltaproteobacteria bacterium]|nr:bifunctional adenosylcobinamide kinase/adenosylcobinamide-phosphate guanylyltransferase [Deltaproteobacteria bacterium]
MLVLGGVRSGKSSLALDLCNKMKGDRYFLATAQPFDDEMEYRIKRHQEERGSGWTTVEESVDIVKKIKELDGDKTIILLDCLTLWLSNLYMKYESDVDMVYKEIERFVEGISGIKGRLVLVSNEVGMGIVPENKLARMYRDASGTMNRKVAGIADKVIITFAGLPLVLKEI